MLFRSEVPENELIKELDNLEKKRLHILYNYVESKGSIITLGIEPNVSLADVILRIIHSMKFHITKLKNLWDL